MINESQITHIAQSNDRRDGLDIPRFLSPLILRALPSWKIKRTKKKFVSMTCSNSTEQQGATSCLDDGNVIGGPETNSKNPKMK